MDILENRRPVSSGPPSWGVRPIAAQDGQKVNPMKYPSLFALIAITTAAVSPQQGDPQAPHQQDGELGVARISPTEAWEAFSPAVYADEGMLNQRSSDFLPLNLLRRHG